MVELKPCPFCGASGHVYEDARLSFKGYDTPKWYISCMGCGMQTPTAKMEQIVKIWNRRAGETDMVDDAPTIEPEPQWIPCSERLPDEYGEYRITWVTSCAPSKRFIGDSEYEVTSVWDEERKDFKGEWLLDDYIKNYPDVKVIAWKPLEEPYREGAQE